MFPTTAHTPCMRCARMNEISSGFHAPFVSSTCNAVRFTSRVHRQRVEMIKGKQSTSSTVLVLLFAACLMSAVAHGADNGSNDIVLAPEVKRGFISNGAAASVIMFDPATLKAVKTIQLDAQNPNAM